MVVFLIALTRSSLIYDSESISGDRRQRIAKVLINLRKHVLGLQSAYAH